MNDSSIKRVRNDNHKQAKPQQLKDSNRGHTTNYSKRNFSCQQKSVSSHFQSGLGQQLAVLDVPQHQFLVVAHSGTQSAGRRRIRTQAVQGSAVEVKQVLAHIRGRGGIRRSPCKEFQQQY